MMDYSNIKLLILEIIDSDYFEHRLFFNTKKAAIFILNYLVYNDILKQDASEECYYNSCYDWDDLEQICKDINSNSLPDLDTDNLTIDYNWATIDDVEF